MTTPPSMPPQQPQQPQSGGGYSMNVPARLPIPGNAELLVWLLVEIVLVIIWAASDHLQADGFVVATTALTIGYLLSRGIAKASRVLEH